MNSITSSTSNNFMSLDTINSGKTSDKNNKNNYYWLFAIIIIIIIILWWNYSNSTHQKINDENLDDTAQYHLNSYLVEQGLTPSVVVHRGHSYWLQRTLNRMPDDVKIVVLGSCGGYKNLSTILKSSPNAHIISTKEIGFGDINGPILNYLHHK